ncbi:hypothetical protein LTR37_000547 [Vermiconidia calcicola]|uniref:Uncharacterized protein n=1 Tax=Vermiconidia calcicola TaxID=1690605 RepID=A0ACC3NXB9_9PEZI|nr:hypothetical protein LTR37_000547 [Vermiconidia calcicola]
MSRLKQRTRDLIEAKSGALEARLKDVREQEERIEQEKTAIEDDRRELLLLKHRAAVNQANLLSEARIDALLKKVLLGKMKEGSGPAPPRPAGGYRRCDIGTTPADAEALSATLQRKSPQARQPKRKWADLKDSTRVEGPLKKTKADAYTAEMLARDEDDEEELPVPKTEAEDGIKEESAE